MNYNTIKAYLKARKERKETIRNFSEKFTSGNPLDISNTTREDLNKIVEASKMELDPPADEIKFTFLIVLILGLLGLYLLNN